DPLGTFAHSLEQSKEFSKNVAENIAELTDKMAKLKEEGSQNQTVFERLGVAVTNADGTLRDSTEVLKDFADKIAEIDNPAKQSALTIEALGRANAAMVVLLREGGDGIEAFIKDAEELNPALTEVEKTIGDKLTLALARLSTALEGLS